MTTKAASNLIYTAANAARILGKRFSNLVIEIWFNVVYLRGSKLSRFVSKASFKQMFVDFRKAGSVGLEVVKVPFETGKYMVSSASKDGSYLVSAETNKITCTCQDYQAQKDAFGKGVCKHGYAVLNHLGYNSLADYVRA